MKEVKPVIEESVEDSAEAEWRIESAVREEEDLRGLHFIGADILVRPARALEFHDCLFENCRFTENHADKLIFVDTRFEDCDLSNCNMNGSIMQRASFYRCRATGLILSRSTANNLLISDCICRYLNLCSADWRNATIENSDLSNASLQESHLKAVRFTDCHLTCAELFHTPLGGIDFTTDDIEGILLDGSELRGAIVNVCQASELAKLLGVIIR